MTAPDVPNAPAIPESERGVTLWGAPYAGKSALLGALYASSLRADGEGWSAHPKDCEDEYTQERLKDAYLGLLGRRNTKTDLPAAGEYTPLRLVLRRRGARGAAGAMRVALVDPAGEFSTQLELGSTRAGRALFARMARGAGVLWLFEPRTSDACDARDADDARDVMTRMLTLQHLVALLEQSGAHQLGIPVALCLSKVDCLPAAERDAARADAASALRAHLGETAFTWFEAVCPAMRCFAISSAGTVEGQVRPEGVDEVFDWLAESTQRRVTWRDRFASASSWVSSRRTPGSTSGTAALDVDSGLRRNDVRTWMPAFAGMTTRTRRALVAAATLGVLATTVALTGGRAAWAARLAPPLHALESIPRTIASRRASDDRSPPPATAAQGGEVVGNAAERLAQARALVDAGAWGDALGALTGVTPPSADALRFTWDSLYLVAALEAARTARDAATARRLRAAVRDRATEVLRRGPAGSTRLLGARYARGVACVDGHLACPPREVRDDLTWAMLGPNGMRRAARDRLASLGTSEATP